MSSPESQVKCSAAINSNDILLQTAKIPVRDKYRGVKIINALFDKGSQQSFVTKSLCIKLGLPMTNPNRVRINVFGSDEYIDKQCHTVKIQTLTKHGTYNFVALIVDKICDDMAQKCDNRRDEGLRRYECKY